MADTQNINAVTALQSIDANDSILVSDGNTSLAKIDYNKLAKSIIEQYTGSTLAGSGQSIQSAFNALNSNSFTNPTTLTTSHDMNSIYTPGIYRQCGTDMPLHSPYAQFGGSVDTFANASITVTKARGDADTIQIWTSANSRYTYIRSQVGRANAWSSWLLQPTRNEVDALNSKLVPSNLIDYVSAAFTTSYSSLGKSFVLTKTSLVKIMVTYTNSLVIKLGCKNGEGAGASSQIYVENIDKEENVGALNAVGILSPGTYYVWGASKSAGNNFLTVIVYPM